MGNFSDGIAWVLKGGKYGYINETGKYVVKPKYSSVESFNAFDLCKVSIGGSLNKKTGELKGAKYGFIDRNAREIIKPKYTEVGVFNADGVCWVNVGGKKDKKTRHLVGGKFGYLSVSGVELTKLEYSNVRKSFANGFAWVAKGKKYGYIDMKGRRVTDVKYDAVQDTFHNDMAGVKLKKKYGFVSTKGRGTEIKYLYISDFEDGNALVAVDSPNSLYKFGYINMDGKEIITPIYDDAHEHFREGLTAVMKDNKWAVIDSKGEMITDFEYSIIQSYDKGMAVASKNEFASDGFSAKPLLGLIDKNGLPITPFKYLYVNKANSDSLRMVGTLPAGNADKKWKEKATSNSFNWIGFSSTTQSSIEDNTLALYMQKDPEQSFYSRRRAYMVHFNLFKVLRITKKNLKAESQRADSIKNLPQNVIPEEQQGIGWINDKGEEVIPAIYKDALDFSEGLAAVRAKEDNGFRWINTKNETVLKTNYQYATSFLGGVAAVYDLALNKWGCINKTGEIIIPFAATSVEEAKEIAQTIYLTSDKKVTPRQMRLFRLEKYRPQDKFKINTTIPNDMWDF